MKKTIWLSAAVLVVAVFTVSLAQQIIQDTNGAGYDSGIVSQGTSSDGAKTTDTVGLTPENTADTSGTSSTASDTPILISAVEPDKIIYSGNMTLYTGDFQKTYTDIEAYAKSIGGFVEYSSFAVNTDKTYDYADYGYVQIRVPVAQYDAAMTMIGTYGEVVSTYTNSQNVTQSYRDIQAELDSYRIQEASLNNLLSKATNVADMLAIETELNRIRTEIDTRQSMLSNYDNLIAYSTIYISMYEQDISSLSVTSPFGSILHDIKGALIRSVNLILTILSKLILVIFYILPFAAIAAIVIFIVMKVKRSKKNKLTQPLAEVKKEDITDKK